MSWGQVNLSDTPIGPCDVDLYKEEKASEPAALTEAGPRLHGPGDCVPYVALLLGQLPPTGGDRTEIAADSDLSGAAGIKRDEGGVGVLAIPVALPNCVPAFS